MSRSNPSGWRSEKIPKFEHYSKARLEKIFLHLRSEMSPGESQHSILDEKEIIYAKRELLKIAHELNYDLHQRGRPTSGAQRTAIEEVASGAGKMRTALNELDPLSREAIRSEGESSKKKDKKSPTWNDPESGLPGGDIVKHSVLVATHLERIIKNVLERLPGKKDGRVRRDAEHRAVRQLSRLWSRYHGDFTDDAAFWEFVKVAFEPLTASGAAVPSRSTIGRYRSYQVAEQAGPKKVPDDARAILEAENECLPDDVRTKLAPKEPISDDVHARLDAETERRRQSLEYPARWNPRARKLLAQFPAQKPGRGK
jgi:hypothetical protein